MESVFEVSCGACSRRSKALFILEKPQFLPSMVAIVRCSLHRSASMQPHRELFLMVLKPEERRVGVGLAQFLLESPGRIGQNTGCLRAEPRSPCCFPRIAAPCRPKASREGLRLCFRLRLGSSRNCLERLMFENVALSRVVPQPAIVYCTSSMAVAVLSVKGFLSVFGVYRVLPSPVGQTRLVRIAR
jgi:hypothetical protein